MSWMYLFFITGLVVPAHAEEPEDSRLQASDGLAITLAKLSAPDERTYTALQRWFKVSPSTDYYAAIIGSVHRRGGDGGGHKHGDHPLLR